MILRFHWRAVVLAAGRGADDPMAKAFGVSHKCTVPVLGVPMLRRVLSALEFREMERPVLVSIDDRTAGETALGGDVSQVRFLEAQSSAPSSAGSAVVAGGRYPVLITTADHPLLTEEIVITFLNLAEVSGADFIVGLAAAETILAAYPETKRTFFRLGPDRVSGCNLFAVMNDRGLRIFDLWSHLEKNRKNPMKLVAAFGLVPLAKFILGRMTLSSAFEEMSKRLNINIKPALLPFAEAAIDVDKPADHALVEKILSARATG